MKTSINVWKRISTDSTFDLWKYNNKNICIKMDRCNITSEIYNLQGSAICIQKRFNICFCTKIYIVEIIILFQTKASIAG